MSNPSDRKGSQDLIPTSQLPAVAPRTTGLLEDILARYQQWQLRRDISDFDELLYEMRLLIEQHGRTDQALRALHDQELEHALRRPVDLLLTLGELTEKVIQNQNALAAAVRQGQQELQDAQRAEELKARQHAFELQKLDLKSDLLAGFATLAREIGQAQTALVLAQLVSATSPKNTEEAGKQREGKEAKADISPALQAVRELSETIRRDEDALSPRIALLKARIDQGTATHLEVQEYYALLSQLAEAEKKNRTMKATDFLRPKKTT